MTAPAIDDLRLEAGDARLTVSPAQGGRMTSLVVGDQELLVTEGWGPIRWGCYPMAPFAGRIREGRFRLGDRPVQLPRNLPPNAIHGTVFERVWTSVGPDAMSIDLGPDWPVAGRVDQRFVLRPDGLEVTLTLVADAAMPASVGWHPWFRRRLSGTVAAPLPPSAPIELAFTAGRMLERGPDDLPTGAWRAPGPHPWDDCFTDVAVPPRVTWPELLTLELGASTAFWVVYDEPEEGICVEPQSAVPDAVNLAAAGVEGTGLATVAPGAPLTATMTWRWAPA